MPGAAELSSLLAAPADRVWRHVASVEGIRFELAPWLSMTFPPEIAELTEQSVPIGARLCRSWIKLLGLFPMEYDDVTLVELEPGRRFLERSSMATLSRWEHERIVEPLDEASCRLTDRLRWTPRLAPAGRVAARLVPLLFAHRHRRLAQRFGVRAAR
jgi:hypothetical protein